MNKLFPLSLVLALVLAACGTPIPIPTPPDVSTLPDPTTLTYEQYDSAVIGITLEPGESRTIQTTDGRYFTVFFAGKADEKYVGYISQWNGSEWTEWAEVAVTADGSVSHEDLGIEAETRPQEPCVLDVCFNEVDWYTIYFDGVRNK